MPVAGRRVGVARRGANSRSCWHKSDPRAWAERPIEKFGATLARLAARDLANARREEWMRPLAAIGECMIELSEHPDGRITRAFGGDTLNTAVYLARLGIPVEYKPADGEHRRR